MPFFGENEVKIKFKLNGFAKCNDIFLQIIINSL